MALAVDSFERLAEEIFRVFSSIRDGLAIVGAAYAAKQTLTFSGRICGLLRTHVIARVVPVNLRRYGAWAVVTGCTQGIGQAFTLELAARGINIVLVSRSVSKLDSLATHLEKTFSVQTATIPVDFNDGRAVYDVIKKGLEGKEVGILVNNVGVMYDYPMDFLEVSEDKLWQLININIAAATMMTHLVLPQMVERGRGAVINMASGAGIQPTPKIAVYSATKTYLDYMSRALNYEYKRYGVTIQCLMPFYIATRMTEYSSTLSHQGAFIPSATTFVRHALTTLGWTDRTPGYWPHSIQLWLASLIPDWLWLWASTRLHNALRRQATQRIRHRSGNRPRSRPSSQLLSGVTSSSSLEHLTGIPSSTSLDRLIGVQSSSSGEYFDASSTTPRPSV